MDTEMKELEQAADLLKVLSHPVRLCIVKRLLDEENCNVSFMQNCLGLPQSTISTHLQKLRTAGIVDSKRKGLEVSYFLCNEKVKTLIPILFNQGGTHHE